MFVRYCFLSWIWPRIFAIQYALPNNWYRQCKSSYIYTVSANIFVCNMPLYTLGKKGLLHPHWRQWNQCGSNFCVFTWLKLAWYGPVIVPQRNPTLPWADIQCKVKWDRRAPKPQYRWSFPQINLHTVTNLNQYLHIFSKVFLIVRTMPRPTPCVLGMRCLHLPVRALSKVLLLPVWVWLVLPSTTYSKGMLPLDLWCQASLQGLPE